MTLWVDTSTMDLHTLYILGPQMQLRDNWYTYIYMFLNERREGRKKEASKVKQTNKAKQHSTPKAVTFPRKNELPRVGLEPTTLYTPDMYMYIYTCMYMYIHSSYCKGGEPVLYFSTLPS